MYWQAAVGSQACAAVLASLVMLPALTVQRCFATLTSWVPARVLYTLLALGLIPRSNVPSSPRSTFLFLVFFLPPLAASQAARSCPPLLCLALTLAWYQFENADAVQGFLV